MRVFLRSVVLAGLAITLAACGSGGSSSPEASGTAAGGGAAKVIGFSKMNSNNPFFEVIAENIRTAGKAHGFEVRVVSADGDVAMQMDQIRDFVVARVDAIVLNPADSAAIGAAISEANQAGIPVFTCDLECTAEGVEIAGHIATDNYQGGRLAGEAMERGVTIPGAPPWRA
jgi:ribose transport system substrate-binding protein